MRQLPFPDRAAAGRALAAELSAQSFKSPVVYALPRGGVPVAVEIAKALNAPLDLLLVRKIGAPGQEELAVGSIVDGERPDIILNEDIIAALGVSRPQIESVAARELREIERRRALYLPGRAPVSAAGRTAILVDDGVATGASMKAAIAAVRRRTPERVVVAAPVAAPETAAELKTLADDVVCLDTPARFGAVGFFYRDFHQLEDDEVIALLASSGEATTHCGD
ncbi:phosphoribosyltransferase [Vitreimonas sp.]|uniref:phosphoribosyltransferase n=1 Tax=Vitreimonas sp. TaxID=3069702 RepID=UPI002ED868A1